jgi:hypothetical protein
MKLVIPTKGRVGNQLTLNNLPADLHVRCVLVCPSYEVDAHHRNHPYIEAIEVQPDDQMGISAKRKWIIDTCEDEKIVMLDDDLRFAHRREDDPGLFRKATDAEIIKVFAEMENILSEDVPHAGLAARGGSIGSLARQGGWQISGKRAMYVLAYHLPTVRQHAEFGRVFTHEDIDVTLQLLSKGYPNAINFSLVVDQKLGNPGGCSDERDIQRSNEDVLKLFHLHPKYVTVGLREYEHSPSRLEVTCQWQKCLEDGMEMREL